MNVGIIGSRTFTNYTLLKESILSSVSPDEIDCIVSGGAAGADTLAEEFAEEYGIRKKIYTPNYRKFGRSAAHERNTDIILESDFVFAFWNGRSTGTKDSIDKAERMGVRVQIIYFLLYQLNL